MVWSDRIQATLHVPVSQLSGVKDMKHWYDILALLARVEVNDRRKHMFSDSDLFLLKNFRFLYQMCIAPHRRAVKSMPEKDRYVVLFCIQSGSTPCRDPKFDRFCCWFALLSRL